MAFLPLAALSACQGGEDEATSPPAPGQAESAQREAVRVDDRVPIPAWFPSNIFLPDDYEATQALEIGSRTFLLRGISQMSIDDLMATYRAELAKSGYRVVPRERMASDEAFVIFNGQGMESAGVRIRDDGDRREIQINFSKDLQE